MIKWKTLGSVGILALLLGIGTVAHAQNMNGSFKQSSNRVDPGPGPDDMLGTADDVAAVPSAVLVAAELFDGSGVELDFDEGTMNTSFQPVYKLTYDAPTGTGTGIGAGEKGRIHYTLSNAVFDKGVSPNDFAVRLSSEVASQAGKVSIVSGGRAGSSSVTIEVWTVTGTGNEPRAFMGGEVIHFTLPDLEAKGASRISAAFSVTEQSGFPDEGGPTNAMCYDSTAKTPQGCPLVRTASYVTLGVSSPAEGKINLMDRTKLTTGTKDLADIAIGTVTVSGAGASSMIKGTEGEAASFTSDLSGNVVITVSSDQLRSDDIVYIDDGRGGSTPAPDDPRERFTISGTMATADRQLAESGTWVVRYRPNGTSALMHNTKIKVSATTDFADRNNKNLPRKSVESTLVLNGILKVVPPKAYAIAPITATDISNVRITCESATACDAFLSCHDSMGNDYFGDAGINVPGNGTVALQQDDVDVALGNMAGSSWTGRLSCDVLSTAPVSIQVLTRAEGVLVNNTYVGQ